MKTAIDAKQSHVEKIKEIGFVKNAICCPYESLDVPDDSVEAIFFYTAHGLKDHSQAIREACRVLKPGGRMLVLLYNENFKRAFFCHRLGQYFSGSIGQYFDSLDNGRYEEITGMSKSLKDWQSFFQDYKLSIKKTHTGLSHTAWIAYDLQTRPVLKCLIRFFNVMPDYLRTTVKLLWMLAWYPIILMFYIFFSNEYFILDRNSCYLAYELEKSASIYK